MRTLFSLFIILTCLEAFAQGTTPRLPNPTQAQINDEHVNDKGLNYLEGHFKKTGDRIVLKTFSDCKDNCVCSWEQQFVKGITYQYNDCHESGFDIGITFQKYDIKEVIKLVDTLFKTENNVWNKDKTEYKPKDEGVGCYYEIKQKNGVVILDYYCGC